MDDRPGVEALEHQGAVGPKPEVEAGVVLGAGIGLEPEDQQPAGVGRQVELERLPGGVGPQRVEQNLAVGLDPKRNAVRLARAHRVVAQRGRPSEPYPAAFRELDVELLERGPRPPRQGQCCNTAARPLRTPSGVNAIPVRSSNGPDQPIGNSSSGLPRYATPTR